MGLRRTYRNTKNFIKDRISILKGECTSKELDCIEIDIMGSCTNKCFMCPARAGKKKNRKMSDKMFEKIINQLAERNFKGMIYLLGQCEPYLDKQLFEKINFVNEKLPEAVIRIISNFTILNDETIKKTINSPIDLFTNSIYALDPINYEKICGRPNFDKAFKNQIKFVKEYAKASPQPEFLFSIYLIETDFTKPEEDFLMYFLSLIPVPETLRTGLINTKGILHQKTTPHMFSKCIYTPHVKIVNSGDMTICSLDHDSIYKVGNISEDNVYDVINNKKARTIRRKMLFSKQDISSCQCCDYGNTENKFLYFLPIKDELRQKLTRKYCNPVFPRFEVVYKNSPEQIAEKLEKYNQIFKDGEEDKWLDALQSLREEFYGNKSEQLVKVN